MAKPENAQAFMDAGGLAALFSLYPLVLPVGRGFLARVSALSPR